MEIVWTGSTGVSSKWSVTPALQAGDLDSSSSIPTMRLGKALYKSSTLPVSDGGWFVSNIITYYGALVKWLQRLVLSQ